MKEKQARELMDELFERHNLHPIPLIFYPKPITTKSEIITPMGSKLTHKQIIYGFFRVKMVRDEPQVWIEFWGLPSENTVRHEFKHYLDWLGQKYIRKRPDS